MAKVHNLGFPRIGAHRELKFALERFWRGEIEADALYESASDIQRWNLEQQSDCDYVPVGDFSLYDHVLDTSFLLGCIPDRVASANRHGLDAYFQVARGRSFESCCQKGVVAGEMTKWFNSNYHYIVPEFSKGTQFSLHADALISNIRSVKRQGLKPKPVLLGPLTFLWLGKTSDNTNKLDLLEQLIPQYFKLLEKIKQEGIEWVQIDEPILVTELESDWQQAFESSYHKLQVKDLNILLATYFGYLGDNQTLLRRLPVAGLHIDAINAKSEIQPILDWLPSHRVLSLGVVNGRNIWKTDLNSTLDFIEPIAKKLGQRLWLAPSCSLLHVPVDLDVEKNIPDDIKGWLSFAKQKLEELSVLSNAINNGRESVKKELEDNFESIRSRHSSRHIHNAQVQYAAKQVLESLQYRQSRYTDRAIKQKAALALPKFPTTTIGSFPQTQSIRKTRRDFKNKKLSVDEYQKEIRTEIERAIREQESLGLDVLVHGEAERNDMVEYFGEQLEGYVFSEYGWVQSYGSRCVKPPILFGDISRPKAMTVHWAQYAQSLTDKPVKGMLTGPVTILNWSFVRDDQDLRETCKQIALAIRDEVLDLEKAGINIIQIDEAALREGLPLRRSDWQDYLDWAVSAFKLCANGVSDETQIHTHMCYSEFNDIIKAISDMDADVITIETSRSHMELLDVFEQFEYPNEIGPGVYDIHSPNIPTPKAIVDLIRKAETRIPKERLWINPDCGLKTRQWDEVVPALRNMVSAAKELRALR